MRGIASALVLLLVSCSTPQAGEVRAQDGRDFIFATLENASSQRFDLEIRSTTARQLCVSSLEWPTAIGQTQILATIEVGSQRYPSRQANFGYPLGDIYIRLASGQRLTSFVAFSEFDPAAFASEGQRRLVMRTPSVVFCHPGSSQ